MKHIFLSLALGLLPALARADGDAVRGRALWQERCSTCHALDENRVGPRHRDVFGRHAGSVAGFGYSSALRQSAVTWNAETLERWLTDPEQFIPGQRMYYKVSDAGERRAIIAYLRQLHPAP